MAAGNNANIWFQYRHKFDELFTANEQIIPETHFLILSPFKGHNIMRKNYFLANVTAFSVNILMSRRVNLRN